MNFRGFMGFAGRAWQYARPNINLTKAPKKIGKGQLGKLTGMETLVQLARVTGLPTNVQIANLRQRLLRSLCETTEADSLLKNEGKLATQGILRQTRIPHNYRISNIELGCLSPMSIMHQNQITLKRTTSPKI